MKQIWARIGMSVEVTDEEYEEIRSLALDKENTKRLGEDSFGDLDIFPEWLTKRFATEGKIYGDCYIPESFWYY